MSRCYQDLMVTKIGAGGLPHGEGIASRLWRVPVIYRSAPSRERRSANLRYDNPPWDIASMAMVPEAGSPGVGPGPRVRMKTIPVRSGAGADRGVCAGRGDRR